MVKTRITDIVSMVLDAVRTPNDIKTIVKENGLDRSTVTKYLKAFVDAGVVFRFKKGRRFYYVQHNVLGDLLYVEKVLKDLEKEYKDEDLQLRLFSLRSVVRDVREHLSKWKEEWE